MVCSSVTPDAAAASSGSNGSPATDAPSSTRRLLADSCASSSVSAAATQGRDLHAGYRHVAGRRNPGSLGGPSELLEVERVAP